MPSALPVTITNFGTPITNVVGGAPVTLVGGNAVAIKTGQQIASVPVDGVARKVTFTVVNGVITAITTAAP